MKFICLLVRFSFKAVDDSLVPVVRLGEVSLSETHREFRNSKMTEKQHGPIPGVFLIDISVKRVDVSLSVV